MNKNETLPQPFCSLLLTQFMPHSSFCPVTFVVAVCLPVWVVMLLLLSTMPHASLWALQHPACSLCADGAL